MDYNLMMAVLSLHAYDNDATFNSIGNATVLLRSPQTSGFAANRYSYNGQTVIAFRGTDGITDLDDWAGGLGSLTPQSALAADFYRDGLSGDNIYGPNTVFTGHSLGGGLAGLLGSIYGKQAYVFDEMAYASSATYLHNVATNPLATHPPASQAYMVNTYYGSNQVNAINSGGISGWQLDGQALQGIGQSSTAVVGAGVDLGLSAVDLHSMSLLVAMLYEKDNVTEKDWHNISKHVGAVWNSNSDRADRIAYTVVDEGSMPFGNAAIKSLFNDLNDIGKHSGDVFKADPNGTGAGVSVESLLGAHFTLMATEYADGLASSQAMQNAVREYGVFRSDDGFLAATLDSSSAAWTSATEKTAIDEIRLSVNHLLTLFPEMGVGPEELASATALVNQAKLLVVGSEGIASVDAILPKFNTGYHFTGTGDPQSVLLGSAGNNKLAGADDEDLLVGGTGNDWLSGGRGKDMLFGGAGDDILYGGSMTFVESNDFEIDYYASGLGDTVSDLLAGGEGNDIYAPSWAQVTVRDLPFSATADLGSSFLTSFATLAPGMDVISDSDGVGVISPYPWPGNMPPNITWREYSIEELYPEYRYQYNIDAIGWDFAGRSEGSSHSSWLAKIVNGELIVCMIQNTATGFSPTDTRDVTLWFNYKMDASADFLQPGGTGNLRLVDAVAALAAGGAQPVGSHLGMRFTMPMNKVAGTTAVDLLLATNQDDYVQAMAGNDSVNAGVGHDLVDGGDGNDTVNGEDGDDTLYGDAGNDRLNGGSGNDYLEGGLGNDILTGASGSDRMAGGEGDDKYFVNSSTDTVVENAYSGTDTIQSSVTIAALAANVENLILSGTGSISGTGNALDNTITGNAGNNTLNGAAGVDTLVGGLGNDNYVVDTTTDVIVEDLNAGTDTIQSSVTITALTDNVERLTLTGTGNINGTGNVLANLVTGNVGNNILNGGAGHDVLTGGAGRDIFMFNAVLSAATNIETITDFVALDDTIRLQNTGAGRFTALADGVLPAAAFVSNATGVAGDAEDRIIYNSGTGGLFYDADGTGAIAAVQFATLTGAPAITAVDFLVI